MSVINQMLKDLEERAPEPGRVSLQSIAPKKTATLKIILLTTAVLLSLNALGFYIWNLQKTQIQSDPKKQKLVNLTTTPVHEEQTQTQAIALQAPAEVKKKAIVNLVHQSKVQLKSESESEPETETKPSSLPIAQRSQSEVQAEATQESTKGETFAPNISDELDKKEHIQQTQVTEQAQVIEQTRLAGTELVNIEVLPPTNTTAKANGSRGQMSVSRRQLTSSELIVQKLARAEKSINNNDIIKAEQLFEDILIIDPNQKQARKKLAALWFGRQAYQQAVNLLSQGIAIDKFDSEMRLMKAQIQLKQGQETAAYNTLKPLASIEQKEYQVMLANIAQKIEQYPSAIMAYQVLIKMQPDNGRWYLGLAIVYDKNSQFSLAVNAYALALAKADLSASSVKFAKQRMQALGE
ncbi:tetratricopeptide repeat protein [Colwellia sp. E150_009]